MPSPFQGTIQPKRIPLLAPGSDRPTLPFPHPWNYREPLRILETFFVGAESDEGHARHNRYLQVPGFAPVLVTRDPRLIRAISAETGDREGQFDRDTMPSSGIARATGPDTLLYANGPLWKKQKKLSTPPFARTTLFQPEQFREFEHTFRRTAAERLRIVHEKAAQPGASIRVALEPEIKAVMLELLACNFFGAEIPYDDIRDRYVPALDRVIDHIVRDTVIHRFVPALRFVPGYARRIREAAEARAVFEELTDLVIAPRKACRGQWGQFRSDASDDALRSNIRVFLAGALEATTSYASWAISHLARSPADQQRVFEEARLVRNYTPETLDQASHFGRVLNETLRLTPALYFHPRRATADTWVEISTGDRLMIPKGTHILLDVWHANRHEDHWGVAVTGYPASEFHPNRWETIDSGARGDLLHFGFGHGPRFCPGKSLGQLEVALVVGACVRLFEFKAASPAVEARAGVSTKPADGVLVDLRPRTPDPHAAEPAQLSEPQEQSPGRCPFAPSPTEET